MASDGRYMYQHQPTINTSYDYASYPPPPPPPQAYDVPQPRQLRPTSSSSPYNQPPPPPPPYPTYAPAAAYMTQPPPPPPPPQPQWTGDGWHYAAYSHPAPAPHPQHPQHPHQQQQQQHQQHPQHPQHPQHLQQQQQQHPPPPPPPQQDPRYAHPQLSPGGYERASPLPRRREGESSPVVVQPPPLQGTPPALDFLRLLHSYRLVMDDATDISNSPGSSSRHPPIEQVDRMLHSAMQGAQTLEAIRVAVEAGMGSAPSPAETLQGEVVRLDVDVGGGEGVGVGEEGEGKGLVNGDGDAAVKTQKTEENGTSPGGNVSQEGQTCLGCKATSTPEWRRGPLGPRTLCNACGLVYAKIIKRRVRDQASGKTNGNGEHSAQESGDSDDDDEYESQGRGSEEAREST